MGVARRWSWVVVLVVGLLLFEFVRRAIVSTGNPNFVPALILLGAAVAPATFVAFIATRRLVFGVGGAVIGFTALVGGVVGVVTAGTLEYDTLRRLGMTPMLAVGLIEEAAKLIAPLALVLVLRHRRLADGLLIGVASGAGFAALETMGYAFVTLIQSGGNLSAVTGVLLVRGLLSPAAHMAWTGITAAALWAAAGQRWNGAGIARLAGAYLVAVLLHTAWDSSPGTMEIYVVLSAISLAVLAFTAHRLAATESRGLERLGPGTRELRAS